MARTVMKSRLLQALFAGMVVVAFVAYLTDDEEYEPYQPYYHRRQLQSIYNGSAGNSSWSVNGTDATIAADSCTTVLAMSVSAYHCTNQSLPEIACCTGQSGYSYCTIDPLLPEGGNMTCSPSVTPYLGCCPPYQSYSSFFGFFG
ncbi:hypothetical protein WJX73_005444 [Symbiochloris irregularis]|uniref:Uncharacterized protein n=1 Tax=Symbiochloris irregularis TaxID=706552 RepID=A0AAW1PNI7_9CHLO